MTMDVEDELRRGLTLISEHLDDEPNPVARRGPTVRSRAWRPAGLVLGAAAAIAVCVLVVSLLPASMRSGNSTNGTGRGQTWAEWVSCSRMIFLGSVTAAEPSQREARVTFRVSDWLKPASGNDEITLDLALPVGEENPWVAGPEQWLVAVPQRGDLPADGFTGQERTDYTPRVKELLNSANPAPCPAHWQRPPQ